MEATLTVLFTDAVASTEALARLGDERFGAVQRAHLGALRECVAGSDGREVKSLGDGLMVVFTGAADALACAVAMQQSVELMERRGEDGLALRVGVALGDVTVDDDGDCQGTAVVEAARLCAAAAPGQVLATEVVRVVAGSRGGHAFTALGPIELRGLPEPVPVTEVGWAPVAQDGGLAPVPLPPRLAFRSAWAFVGRAAEIECLEAVWRDIAGGVRVALLGGEPGAGKTRLARELAVRAHEQGALVLFGHVDEDLAVAYQPYAEALRHYLSSVDEKMRTRVLTLRGRVLARLVPELVEELPTGQVDAPAIFEGLVDWLSIESARRPVVLVLDDLQWAANPTLKALMHLVRSSRLSQMLIVATYRDTELDRTHPLADVLADLRREEGVERLAVRGLAPDGVAAMVQAARGDVRDDAARQLIELLSEQTQGNPFFVGQVLRHLSETGAVEQVDGRWMRTATTHAFVIPEGVREVVGRRVSRLSEQAGKLLTVAAVAGLQFDVATVAEVAGQLTPEALDGLDEALAARLVLETGSPGQLRFAHALVRQTLEDELSTMRRLHLHQQIGLTLERRFGDAESVVPDLAHHFSEAAALGEGERASRYAERAALQALGRAAPEQGADLLEHALELMPVGADPDGHRRERLYAQLAPCCWAVIDMERLGQVSRAWVALARDLGDEAMLMSAAAWLADGYAYSRVRATDDLAVVADALRVDVSSLNLDGRQRRTMRGAWQDLDRASIRAVLVSNLAVDCVLGLPFDAIAGAVGAQTPQALADEACSLAEQSSDPEVSEDSRFLRTFVLLATPEAALQLRDAERAIEAGITMWGGGQVTRALALSRLGLLDAHRAAAEALLVVAGLSGDRSPLSFARLTQARDALLRGRFDQARAATQQLLELAPDQLWNTTWHQELTVAMMLATGRPEEALEAARRVDESPLFGEATHHLAVACAAVQRDVTTARAALEEWHASGRPLPTDANRSGTLWALAECAVVAGDGEAARCLYDALVPYDGQMLLWRMSFVPASAAFLLGRLAETLAEVGRAHTHYTDALSFEQACGAEMLAARTGDVLERIS